MSVRERTALALLALGVVIALIGAFTISPNVGFVTLGGLCFISGLVLGDI